MSDDFFDDEQELMSAVAAEPVEAPVTSTGVGPATSAAAAKSAKSGGSVDAADCTAGARSAESPEKGEPAAPAPAPAKPAATATARQAPPFWMVLAIAAIALMLGVVIGYLLGSQAMLAELGQASTQATSTTSTSSATELPEGHPQLNIAEDGTATVAGSGSAE